MDKLGKKIGYVISNNFENTVMSLINETQSNNAQYKMADAGLKTHSLMWEFDQC